MLVLHNLAAFAITAFTRKTADESLELACYSMLSEMHAACLD